MQYSTLNNYLTDYQFNPNASDIEIMQIAEASLALKIKSRKLNKDFYQKYSDSFEVIKGKQLNVTFQIN